MAKHATAHDAQVILKLYDVRREAEMRKARLWVTGEFWPQSTDDIIKVMNASTTPENAWLRQVASYWEMAAAFVLHGAINEALFTETGCSGEMYFVFAKIQPFLKELREKTGNPYMFSNVEKVATRTKDARKRFERMARNVEVRRKALAKPAKKG